MKITIYQVKIHLSTLIKQILKRVVLLKYDDGPWSCLGKFEGKIKVAQDFNNSLAEFDEYV